MNESRFSGNASEDEEEEEEVTKRSLYHQSTAFKFAILARDYPIAYYMNQLLPFFVYAVGFVGNSISAVLWFQRRLNSNHSSAFYLALTLIDHLFYLALHCVDHLDMVFQWNLTGRCYLYCEVYLYLLNFTRYLSPLLVLGFVGQRFVAICYPLQERFLCRTRTAKTYAAIAGIAVAVLSVAHPVFWTMDPAKGFCGYRDLPGVKTVWLIFTPVTEVFFFAGVPLVVVVLDLIVVLALCRIRRKATGKRPGDEDNLALQKLSDEKQIGGEGGGGQDPKEEGDRGPKKKKKKKEKDKKGKETQRPMRQEVTGRVPAQVTTAFILTVSMYEAVCLVAESVVYLLLASYPPGETRMTEAEIVKDPIWVSYFRYSAAQCIVYALTLTRHGCFILLFLAIAARYRRALCDHLRCQATSPAATAAATERTGITWLSSSTSTAAGSRSRSTKEML